MRLLSLTFLLGFLAVIALFVYEAAEGNFQDGIQYKGTLFVIFLLGFLWSWNASYKKSNTDIDKKPVVKFLKTLVASYVLGGIIIFGILVVAKVLTLQNAEVYIQSNFQYLALPLAFILIPFISKRIK